MDKAVDALYANRDRFIVIGLTGRTGAGCSTVAGVLSKNIAEFVGGKLSISDSHDNEDRKSNILKSFVEKNWQPFYVIKVRDIISTFLLEREYEEVIKYIGKILPGADLLGLEELFKATKQDFACLKEVLDGRHDNADAKQVMSFLADSLNSFTNKIKEMLDERYKDVCIKAYQEIGDNIRLYGNAIGVGEPSGDNVYAISRRINLIIKALRNYNTENGLKDYFVIDAFRNPIEVKFFQERYAGFYLWGINAPEQDRCDRLHKAKIMDIEEIHRLDKKEYTKNKVLKGERYFVTQDIAGCIQSADVLIRNSGKFGGRDFASLYAQIIKYVSLIKHPGLVTPSRDERCMQTACVAKLNSGCISRQVGAAVADENGYIRSIGWNDAPAGQTPCLLKNSSDLINRGDLLSYSEFEKNDTQFEEKVKDRHKTLHDDTLKRGLNPAYCFKDLYNEIKKDDNQVHTRALHAEENAFLALISGYTGSSRLHTLYTTSSPCVLCAKKAYQLGIKRVVYIDPYPDIAFEHILENGKNIPTSELYFGALGSAFHRLYLPVVALKDELKALTPMMSSDTEGASVADMRPAGDCRPKACRADR